MKIQLAIGAALTFLGIAQSTFTSYATHFDGIGQPYGGCGIPESLMGYPHYLALNVQNTPNDYGTFLHRPISNSEGSKIGQFNNGKNCGRFVRVHIGRFCTGVNSGNPGEPFCHNGSLVDDEFTGAYQDYIVTDSCQDGNRWCRDDKNHVDLKTESLRSFKQNGKQVDVSHKWGNREVHWDFIDGPSLEMTVYFGQNAQEYYPAIFLAGIHNGIQSVEEKVNGQWREAKMNSDMGQSFVLTGNNSGVYEIQVKDIHGHTYRGHSIKFTFPSNCPNKKCGTEPGYKAHVLDSAFLQ
eukprot:403368303